MLLQNNNEICKNTTQKSLDNCRILHIIDPVMRKDDMKNFGMFTREGNIVVSMIVQLAIDRNLSYTNLENQLRKLSEIDFFMEATDTVVRERAFEALRVGTF